MATAPRVATLIVYVSAHWDLGVSSATCRALGESFFMAKVRTLETVELSVVSTTQWENVFASSTTSRPIEIKPEFVHAPIRTQHSQSALLVVSVLFALPKFPFKHSPSGNSDSHVTLSSHAPNEWRCEPIR